MDSIQLLLLCGVVAGPLFIIVFLVEGYLRPGYNWLRQPVSALSQGPRGWTQQSNFFISGALLIACAWGLFMALAPLGSLWGPLLIGFYALGLIGAGIFVTDHGMPSQASPHPARTTAGLVHDLFSSVVFLSLCIDCFVFAHIFNLLGSHGWALYSTSTGIFYGVGFGVFARAFAPASAMAPIGGLLQRLTLSLGVIWVSLIALYFLIG